MLIKLSIKVL